MSEDSFLWLLALNFLTMPKRSSTTSRRLSVAGIMLVAVIVIAAGLTTWHSREEAMASYRREMSNLGIALAEQTARSVQAIDLVLQEIQAKVAAETIANPEQFKLLMGAEETHRLLAAR